jgi:YD repeat-containing protein
MSTTLRFAVLVGVLCFAVAWSSPALSSTQYDYDSLNRLVKATYDDGTIITYTYDANGNRLTSSVETVTAQAANAASPGAASGASNGAASNK